MPIYHQPTPIIPNIKIYTVYIQTLLKMLGLVTAPMLLLTSNDWQARLNVLNSAPVTLPSTNQTPTGNFDYAGMLAHLAYGVVHHQ